MKKVYVITVGDYSDYHIEGIFSTRELAEECMEACGMTWANLEEYILDYPVDKVKQGMKPFSVEIFRNGSAYRIRGADFLRPVCPYLYRNVPVEGVILQVYVWARDVTHATKIANELRTGIIADNLWPEPMDYNTMCRNNEAIREMYAS